MKWPTVLLPEVAEFDPSAPRNGDLPPDTDVGFLSMSGLDSDCVAVTPGEIRTAAEVSGGFTYFQNGDVLVAKITPCFENGKTAEVSTSAEHCFGSTEFHVIRVYESRLLPRYLTHYLRQPWIREAGQRRMTGSAGQRRVPRSFLQELRLPLPPLEEQRRIAAILDKADALRQKRRLALQKLDSLTQSIFLDLFGDPRETPSAARREKLGDVCIQITDGEHLTPRRSTEGYKLLSARNIRNGYLDFSEVDYVDEAEFRRISSRCAPRKGDLLLSCSGTIGRVCAVRDHEPIVLVRSAALIRPDPEQIRSDYLESWLQLPWMNRIMQQRANASSQANLFQNQIRDLPLLIPNMKQQDEFIARKAEVRKSAVRQFKSTCRMDSLFHSLQSRAFQGEL